MGKKLETNIFTNYSLILRGDDLRKVCDLISKATDARIARLEDRIDKLEEEKMTELNTSMLEKIPECPVNIKLFCLLR